MKRKISANDLVKILGKRTKKCKDPNVIDSFRGEYGFLSNFWYCKVSLDGLEYSSSEHCYQASKSLYDDDRIRIKKLKTPSEAKTEGSKLELRKDWNDVRLKIMYDVLKSKFTLNADLKKRLLETGDKVLIEGNHWGDKFFGQVNGKGENHLGKLLMRVRAELSK